MNASYTFWAEPVEGTLLNKHWDLVTPMSLYFELDQCKPNLSGFETKIELFSYNKLYLKRSTNLWNAPIFSHQHVFDFYSALVQARINQL